MTESDKSAPINNEERPNMSQQKSAADDLTCPITLELPWDPVTAMDGRIYERTAIEAHFGSNNGFQNTRPSPVTNAHINTQLLPAPQIKSLIETLVENGGIGGDLASKWNEKVRQKKDREEMLKKAERGDADNMYGVGVMYEHGSHLVKKDIELALAWYKKAHEAGNVKKTALLGFHICNPDKGQSHSFNQTNQYPSVTGVMYTCLAADRGSNHAAFHLGMALLGPHQKYGLKLNETEGIQWLQKAVGDCLHDHLNAAEKMTAQNKLSELQARSARLPGFGAPTNGAFGVAPTASPFSAGFGPSQFY
jgi:U-box domain/Sel1 repeat